MNYGKEERARGIDRSVPPRNCAHHQTKKDQRISYDYDDLRGNTAEQKKPGSEENTQSDFTDVTSENRQNEIYGVGSQDGGYTMRWGRERHDEALRKYLMS